MTIGATAMKAQKKQDKAEAKSLERAEKLEVRTLNWEGYDSGGLGSPFEPALLSLGGSPAEHDYLVSKDNLEEVFCALMDLRVVIGTVDVAPGVKHLGVVVGHWVGVLSVMYNKSVENMLPTHKELSNILGFENILPNETRALSKSDVRRLKFMNTPLLRVISGVAAKAKG